MRHVERVEKAMQYRGVGAISTGGEQKRTKDGQRWFGRSGKVVVAASTAKLNAFPAKRSIAAGADRFVTIERWGIDLRTVPIGPLLTEK